MNYRSYPYRWVILFSVFPVLAMTQICWLTFSAISVESASYFHTSSLNIAFLSMSYMIVYILLTVPASRLADKKGLRASFFFGAIITALFGLLRGFCSTSFPLAVIAQMGMAIAQPFLVNPITKLAATWFPMGERATASGISSIAGYVGIIIAMLATPILYQAYSMDSMLKIYGVGSVVCAVIVLIFLREAPKTPAGPLGSAEESFSFKNTTTLRQNKNFMLLLFVVFIALGFFNALLTCISDIMSPRGITSNQSGLLGGVIILAGMLGAILIPVLSDKYKRRSIILSISLAASLIGIIGLSFSPQYFTLLFFAALSGFFLMGAGPVLFQFGTEIAYPIPEGSSYGLLMGSGQISGILFIVTLYLMRAANGSMSMPLSILIVLMIVSFFVSLRIKDSSILLTCGNLKEDGISLTLDEEKQ